METESRTKVTRDWGEEGGASQYLMDTEFQRGLMKPFWTHRSEA